MKLNYQIKMLSDWHIGSGLDAGVEADTLVLKDENKFPFIPGKTIKGLFRDALTDMKDVGQLDGAWLDEIFGKPSKNNQHDNTEQGKAFFSNAILADLDQQEIQANHLQDYLYRNIASTAIRKDGIAKQGSLRVLEVCIPLQLNGYIDDLSPTDKPHFIKAFQWLRHLGVSRNRGLGRCQINLL